ncbi:MAG: hypothetical protein H0T91_06110 [Propionibacteriaceae bacterium]|nr:hypothetical protein [Propionibacteriaceae bacterium]
MDLESVAAELYGTSPEKFVEHRSARVADARAAGDRNLAKAIAQLRRPTRSAWLVNLLARQCPDEVQQLLQVGVALGEAQRRSSGADLRRLSKERHAALENLTRRATEIAAEHGRAVTNACRQEVSQTLQAALSDPSVAEVVRTGQVTQPVTYGGFGPVDLFSVAPPPDVGSELGSAPLTEEHEVIAEDVTELARAREAVRAADEALRAAQAVAAAAETEAGQARMQADSLAHEAERLRSQLREAEAAEGRGQELARTSRERHRQQQLAVVSAEHQLNQAVQALADLKVR